MNAELLIMFTLDCNRAYLYAHPERELTAEEMSRYDDAIGRRTTGVPAQYITGHQEFWGMDLIVTPAVLIPRPETEHVVEAVLEVISRDQVPSGPRGRTGPALSERSESKGVFAPHERGRGAGGGPALRLVDVGTGSGAIALALAAEMPSAEIHATEISAEALEVAQANAARHELSSRIAFHRADLLGCFLRSRSDQGFQPGLETSGGLAASCVAPAVVAATPLSAGDPTRRGEFDFVVSNPPYVGEAEEDQVQLEVRKFEPRDAVFGGPTGLEVIQRLIPQAHEALRPGGWLVFEISGTIAEGVRRLLARWDEVAIKNDLQGIARVAVARKSPSR